MLFGTKQGMHKLTVYATKKRHFHFEMLLYQRGKAK